MAEQDPDLYEEIVIEDEESASNRPFILAVGGLLGILLVALLCLGVYQIYFDTDDAGQEIADSGISATATSISATNEAIETQNAFVTQTLEAMELTAQAPTATSTPLPTATATPEPTETPTETPVVQTEDEGDGESEAVATSIFDDSNGVTDGESGGTAGDVTGGTPETLPQTGISVWGGLAAALGLFLVIFVARRMRLGH